MEENILLPIGIHKDTGENVYIEDSLRGAECACLCPACNAPLVAKKGDVRAHHFAHEGGHNCNHATETALHLAAKELLQEAGYIIIPEYIIRLQDRVSGWLETETICTQEKVADRKKLVFDEVRLEHRFHDIVPDILVNISGYELIIEIFVTHKVDQAKLDKIRRLNTSALEITINNPNQVSSQNAFRELIVESVLNKKWLFHARQVHVENAHLDKVRAAEERKKSGASKRYRGNRANGYGAISNANYRNSKSSNNAKLDRFVDREGTKFFLQNGRWPNNEETECIIRRFRRY